MFQRFLASARSALPGLSKGLRREHVAGAIHAVLGRAPLNETEIASYLGLPHRAALFDRLLRTDEFQARVNKPPVIIPPPPLPPPPPPPPPPRTGAVFLGDRVLAFTHTGAKIFLAPTDIDLTPHIIFDGQWEGPVEIAIRQLLRPGERAADVGANVGYYTLALAEGTGPTGEVHSFEANPELTPLLRLTILVNGLERRVHLHPQAVSDRPGTLCLASEPGRFGSGNITVDGLGSHYAETYSKRATVPAIRLDDALAHLPALDLLRMDIEGSEPLALRGAEALIRRSPKLRIVTEWAVPMMAPRADVPAFVSWMAGLGFRFWRIRPDATLEPVPATDAVGLPHVDVVLSREDP